jgi:hypothetical protein
MAYRQTYKIFLISFLSIDAHILSIGISNLYQGGPPRSASPISPLPRWRIVGGTFSLEDLNRGQLILSLVSVGKLQSTDLQASIAFLVT